ncbi:MAG: formylglycine-generating enzyme family protein [Chloroflexi bacterium]|nr:formylglycine-generating enzyme family protein [Chloroflexota bacterium]
MRKRWLWLIPVGVLLLGGVWTADPLTAIPTPTPAFFPARSANQGWTPIIQSFDGVEMVMVPAGCFEMGSAENENKAEAQPIHTVCFDVPFWLDRYEVSNAQFKQFGGNAGLVASRWSQADHPRERVTWHAARRFCEKRGGRLPTEAEWEYAARGPEGWLYPWGNTFVGENTVYGDTSGGETAPTGSRPAGASWVGALDLTGNVWEWLADWYGPYPTDPQVNPTGPAEGDHRVVRGGSWTIRDPLLLRATNRSRMLMHYTNGYVGFRCARSD